MVAELRPQSQEYLEEPMSFRRFAGNGVAVPAALVRGSKTVSRKSRYVESRYVGFWWYPYRRLS
eukprot:115077-Amphidinium_carterae.1